MIVHAVGILIVAGLVVVEIVIPVAIAFHLGRKAERRAVERAFAEQAISLTSGEGFPRTRR